MERLIKILNYIQKKHQKMTLFLSLHHFVYFCNMTFYYNYQNINIYINNKIYKEIYI